jgi:hypothetical protein
VSGQTTYKRESRVNPFLEDPKSGSYCGKPELEWLQVDFQDNVDIDGITKVTKDVEDILDLKLLEAYMDSSWEDVMNENYPPGARAFYDRLKWLERDLSTPIHHRL